MTGSRCVYTVLTGGYEGLLEQPTSSDSAIDYICFTDDRGLSSSSWNVRTFTPPLPSDAPRNSRYVKILAHRFLADYDTSLYIDNSVLLKTRAEEIFEDLLPPEESFAALAHSYRETVADEFSAVIDEGYETSTTCQEQLSAYRSNHPDVLAVRPIWAGLLLRRHHHPSLQAAMENWWWHVLRYSHRDQLSMMVALHISDMTPLIHDLDNFESRYHEWPRSTGRRRSKGSRLTQVAATFLESARGDPSQSSAVSESSSLIADLTRQLRRQAAVVDDLQNEVDHRQKVIDEVASEAAHRQQVIDDLAAEAAHRLNVIEDLAKVAEQRLESLNEMTRERGELAERAEGLTTELDQLKTAIEASRVMRWLLRRRLGREDG